MDLFSQAFVDLWATENFSESCFKELSPMSQSFAITILFKHNSNPIDLFRQSQSLLFWTHCLLSWPYCHYASCSSCNKCDKILVPTYQNSQCKANYRSISLLQSFSFIEQILFYDILHENVTVFRRQTRPYNPPKTYLVGNIFLYLFTSSK